MSNRKIKKKLCYGTPKNLKIEFDLIKHIKYILKLRIDNKASNIEY